MFKRLLFFLECFLFIILFSCASKKEKSAILEDMAKTPSINSEAELYMAEKNLLTQTPNLNEEQKARLSTLLKKSRKENLDLQNQIDKTKTVLFKELLNPKANKTKIPLLENQLLRLNRKKTRYSLSTYKEAKYILGKEELPLEKTLDILDNRRIHEF